MHKVVKVEAKQTQIKNKQKKTHKQIIKVTKLKQKRNNKNNRIIIKTPINKENTPRSPHNAI